MVQILDGNGVASRLQQEIRHHILQSAKTPPCLAAILVGDHPPSHIYVHRKAKACSEIGILLVRHHFPREISEKALIEEIHRLNHNPLVHAILIQLPLPIHLNTNAILTEIAPSKDVDGLHPENMGKLLMGDSKGFVPCTPLGIHRLLIESKIPIAHRHVVVIGRSNLVGKPIGVLLMQNRPDANASVTIVHSGSQSIETICKSADILIVAIGKPLAVGPSMIKKGAVVIDVGINKIRCPSSSKSTIVGDVDFDKVKNLCSAITPVPGGIGPMTIAMLLANTWKSYTQ